MNKPSRAGATAWVDPPAPAPSASESSGRRKRSAVVAAFVGVGLVTSTLIIPGVAAAALPVAPDNITAFSGVDQVVVDGFGNRAGQVATVEVRRGDQLMGVAKTTLTAAGGFEINHPGGVCWGNDPSFPQVTPDIAAGDTIVVKFNEGGTAFVAADSPVKDVALTKVNYTAGATEFTIDGRFDPATVNPAFLDQRIVNPDLTGTPVARRDVRAVVGTPGVLAPGPRGGYTSNIEVVDATAGTFKVTYNFDDSGPEVAADVAAMAADEAAEKQITTWAAEDAGGGPVGLTIGGFAGEQGGPGMAGCPQGPGNAAPSAGQYAVARSGNTAVVNWTPAAAQPGATPVDGYNIEAVTKTPSATGEQTGVLSRTGKDATRSTLTLPGPADGYDIEVRAKTGTKLSEPFAAAATTPTGGGGTPPAPGDVAPPEITAAQDSATGNVTLTSNEQGTDMYFTTDGTDPLDALGLPADTATLYAAPNAPIKITANVTLKWVGFDRAGNVSTVGEKAFTAAAAPAATAPAAPAGVTTTSGNQTVNLSWTAPANTGGAPIAEYTVTTTAPTGTTVPAPIKTTTTTAAVTGLTNGTEYSFAVTATNSVGTSPPSATVKARPGDTVTITAVRYRQNQELRIDGTGSATGQTYTVYHGPVGNVAASTRLGTPTVTAAVAPATGVSWQLRLRNNAANLPTARGNVIWVQSSGGAIASNTFR